MSTLLAPGDALRHRWSGLSRVQKWGFGAIGFYDDYLKVTKATTKGFSGKVRLLAEFAIAGLAVGIFMWIGDKPLSTSLAVPFFKDVLIPFGIFFIFVGMFVVVGAGNAVNMTDGLDGLAIVPVMIAALAPRMLELAGSLADGTITCYE